METTLNNDITTATTTTTTTTTTHLNNNIIIQQTKELEFNYLQDLCHRGQLAYTLSNYVDAISLYDHVIEHIQGKLIGKIYLRRAIVYEQLGNYQQALQDAQRATIADPTLADGYLVGGNILHVILHQLADASQMYQKGIDHISKKDPKYSQLITCKNQITQEIRQRNTRIIHILPYDIICEIMAKLSIMDRLNFSACCKDFRDYLLDSPVMWQDIHLLPSLLDKIGLIASQHVRRLTLSDIKKNQDVLNRLVNYNWCHIESIHISNSRIHRSSWRQFLQMNKQIKSIQLMDTQAGAEDTTETEGLFHDIFDICSNHLTDLTYIHHIGDRRWYYNFYDRPYPTLKLSNEATQPLALTHLNIACHLTLTYLPQLLPHCSNLKHLAIDADKHEGEDADLIALVERSCPYLHTFHYGNGLMEEDQHITNTMTNTNINNNTHFSTHHHRLRLKQLAYFPNITHPVDHQLAQLVETSHRTLEMFRLSMLMQPATQTLIQLATLGAPQLQRLELLDAPCKYVDKVIRVCPSIRWITLDSVTDNTLDSLMQLEHLQRISISLNMDEITVNKLETFFTSTRSLRHVYISATDHFTDNHLWAIQGHNKKTYNKQDRNHIETLELSGCIATSITVDGIQQFAQQHSETLLQLTLSSTSVPMHDKVVALANLKNLRCLTLRGHGCLDVGKDTVTALFNQRQQGQPSNDTIKTEMKELSVALYRTRDEKPVIYTSDMSPETMNKVERKIQQPDILSRYSHMAWLGMLREP
ncbi:hypothetical protein INT45_010044 [Circinella minor]|uniref:F-box domain-containing protein n=1 Tax=Circinella minor TaxID=1195481 RepID=A0A8H7SBD7_9FUNG|nr:hypothetical protein INT45_010044 [Circinella minor]